MQSVSEQVAQLKRLSSELERCGLSVRLVTKSRQSYLKVANLDTPELNERVLCRPAEDRSLCFWWPWGQPIGSADDLEAAVEKITAVLRSVEGPL